MTTIAVVNDASWTFHNYGPLTTTFTPAPSCSACNAKRPPGQTAHPLRRSLTVTPSPTTSPSDDDEDPWTSSVGNYYSPGLYFPSGWETVGVAGRDGDKAYTTSGAMNYGSSHWIPDFDYMPTLLAKNLKPSETVALCCPSGFTANPLGDCFTTAPSYIPTSICQVFDDPNRSTVKSTSVYTTDGTKIKTVVTSTTTIHSMSTRSMGILGGETFIQYYTPIISVSAVTLIHHESDVGATATGSSSGAATGTGQTTGSTGAAASTSNAAVRLGSRMSSWNGVGAVLSVSLAAAELGAAIILPF
ncbi:uncharacterized protein N7496_008682 [Penicillium cataractarum]|uniref:Uncharacterized protein n=1 Tax=Penicillium cataractarum TaxID=2100454 RepID=A0A9W9V4Z0_9EURO|nr:uncharacterized protein N7496_008682 [Penicillium cataractarum]KAJ5368922.1 hypothetical protein N7496_008682 [Penicillium cataractarum]